MLLKRKRKISSFSFGNRNPSSSNIVKVKAIDDRTGLVSGGKVLAVLLYDTFEGSTDVNNTLLFINLSTGIIFRGFDLTNSSFTGNIVDFDITYSNNDDELSLSFITTESKIFGTLLTATNAFTENETIENLITSPTDIFGTKGVGVNDIYFPTTLKVIETKRSYFEEGVSDAEKRVYYIVGDSGNRRVKIIDSVARTTVRIYNFNNSAYITSIFVKNDNLFILDKGNNVIYSCGSLIQETPSITTIDLSNMSYTQGYNIITPITRADYILDISGSSGENTIFKIAQTDGQTAIYVIDIESTGDTIIDTFYGAVTSLRDLTIPPFIQEEQMSSYSDPITEANVLGNNTIIFDNQTIDILEDVI